VRKVLLLLAAASVVVAAGANTAGLWRIPGGPLAYRSPGPYDGLHLSASLPRGQTLYYIVPQLTGSHEPLIERLEVVGASAGVRVTGLYIKWDGDPASAPVLTLPDPNGRWVAPPARTITANCCEGGPELLIAFQLDAPGPQSIDAIGVDYRDDPWSYHTVFSLADTPSLSNA
jgi:hypothetical protein